MSRAHVRAAAEVAARCYEDDPFYRYMFPHTRRRSRSIAAVHHSLFGPSFPAKHCTIALSATGALMGSAVWVRPGGYPLAPAVQLRQLPQGFRALIGQPHAIARGVLYQRALADQHPTERHWYLWSLTVDPVYQRHGIGSALLREGLIRADADHTGVHLETQRVANHSFYERFGFHRTYVIQPSPTSPALYAMWRNPQS